jgi:hypothetical protein
MATKVSIIDVTLGARVEDIISENVVSLTGKARQELDTAIEERKKVDEVKNKRAAAKKESDDKVTNAMGQVYELLEKAGEDGVIVDDIMAIIQEFVPNTSAFTLRMKKILKDKGHPFRIARKKRNKKAVYTFEPFNQVEILPDPNPTTPED